MRVFLFIIVFFALSGASTGDSSKLTLIGISTGMSLDSGMKLVEKNLHLTDDYRRLNEVVEAEMAETFNADLKKTIRLQALSMPVNVELFTGKTKPIEMIHIYLTDNVWVDFEGKRIPLQNFEDTKEKLSPIVKHCDSHSILAQDSTGQILQLDYVGRQLESARLYRTLPRSGYLQAHKSARAGSL